MNTRRQFLIQAPIAPARRRRRCRKGRSRDAGGLGPDHARRAADVRDRAGRRPAVTPATFAEAEKLAQVHDDAGAARAWRPRVWRTVDGAAARAAHRAAQGRARGRPMRPRTRLESGARPASRPGPRATGSSASRPSRGPLPASDDDIAFAPVTQLVALDRDAEAHLRAAHQHLPRPHRAVRSEAPLRSSRSRGTTRSRRRGRPTRRSRRASIAARCTASRTA